MADDGSASLTLSLLAVLGRRGVTIIVLVICACAVVIIAFLLATVCLVRRRRHRYQKAAGTTPPSTCNGDKSYNCRVETLKAINESSRGQPTRSVVRTLDCSPRTPTGRVVLVADGSGLSAARWDGVAAPGPVCRRQLAPSFNAAPAPDLVTDQALSTFGKTRPPPVSAKRTLSSSDVTSATPDVKV